MSKLWHVITFEEQFSDCLRLSTVSVATSFSRCEIIICILENLLIKLLSIVL